VALVGIRIGFLFGPGVSAAQAQESDPCAIEQFITGDQIDFTAYSACVAALGQTQGAGGTGLARTGPSTDIGQYVGLGAGLIALGAAFIWTSRRNRVRVDS
jgi:hypothetical protein